MSKIEKKLPHALGIQAQRRLWRSEKEIHHKLWESKNRVLRATEKYHKICREEREKRRELENALSKERHREYRKSLGYEY